MEICDIGFFIYKIFVVHLERQSAFLTESNENDLSSALIVVVKEISKLVIIVFERREQRNTY